MLARPQQLILIMTLRRAVLLALLVFSRCSAFSIRLGLRALRPSAAPSSASSIRQLVIDTLDPRVDAASATAPAPPRPPLAAAPAAAPGLPRRGELAGGAPRPWLDIRQVVGDHLSPTKSQIVAARRPAGSSDGA